MRKLNGYMLLVITAALRSTTVVHYSTGNDESVCGRPAPDGGLGYVDSEIIPTVKGMCLACCRYVAKHGDYQGWDSENNVRYLSITNPRQEPVSEAFCAMHREYVTQCSERHGQDDGGFQESPVQPAKKNAFPMATFKDTETHFMGSGALSFDWWYAIAFVNYDGIDAVPDWVVSGLYGEPGDSIPFTLDHASIQRAIRKIANVPQGLTGEPNKLYVSNSVIKECRTWIFKGPDACDFDACLADEVMQVAAIGHVDYC